MMMMVMMMMMMMMMLLSPVNKHAELAAARWFIKYPKHLIYYYVLNPKRHYIGVLDQICHYRRFMLQARYTFYDESDIFTKNMKVYYHFTINSGSPMEIWQGQTTALYYWDRSTSNSKERFERKINLYLQNFEASYLKNSKCCYGRFLLQTPHIYLLLISSLAINIIDALIK